MIIGSIKENLLYGNKDATDADIRDAIERSNAQFVYDLKDQLDSQVGSNSIVNMSGG
jgi:ABC-type multidrug transport system fused ATPase/permease subunit